MQQAGAIESGPVPAVATRRVPGRSLADVLTHDGPLGFEAAARLLAPVAGALAAIHAAGWVHGDVSPANVVVGPSGAVLVDLGEARPAASVGRAVGTPGFTAPEVVAGAVSSSAADVWALAAIVAAAAGGVLPPAVAQAFAVEPAERPDAAVLAGALAAGGEATVGIPQPAVAAADVRALARTREFGPRPPAAIEPVAERGGIRANVLLVAATTVALAVLGWRLGVEPPGP